MQDKQQSVFDYIVIGAGSAGCALAARLSEDSHRSVCLIEAGGRDSSPFIHIPFGLTILARLKKLNWNYNTSPQTELNNRQMYWPRGKTLGGSSSVNAMCYIRGAKEDYDHWAELGAKGWDWASVLPYFKKSENQQHGADEFHGDSGPLSVNDLRHKNVLSESFVAAASEVGEKQITDFNGAHREGLGFYQVTQRDGQRCSAAKAYLGEAAGRENLTILTHALVEKILITNGLAKGVQLKQGDKTITLDANLEVLLSGGAINSPQILMLSGIGPKAHLQEMGIDTLVDLPGVGQNMQDHLDAIVQHRCQAHEGYAVALTALPMYIKAAFKYLFKRNGLISSNVAEAGGFASTPYADGLPDIQYHFLPAILLNHGRTAAFGYGYGVHVCGLYPKSRGEIKLQSADPSVPALIDPKYLTHEDDKKVMIAGVRKAREILAASTFAQYHSREIGPGPKAQSDEEILNFIRSRAETIYHPVSTCKMGADDDPMAVVGSDLCVKGVKGLRVVDASVMPSLIGGNTNAPTIMIAEKAADLIKQVYIS